MIYIFKGKYRIYLWKSFKMAIACRCWSNCALTCGCVSSLRVDCHTTCTWLRPAGWGATIVAAGLQWSSDSPTGFSSPHKHPNAEKVHLWKTHSSPCGTAHQSCWGGWKWYCVIWDGFEAYAGRTRVLCVSDSGPYKLRRKRVFGNSLFTCFVSWFSRARRISGNSRANVRLILG